MRLLGSIAVLIVVGCGKVQNNNVDAPPGTVAFMVSRIGNGQGSVSSTGGEIACGSTCQASVPPGTTITLTATAESSSTFVGWGGACSGIGDCTFTVNADTMVTAEFQPNGLTVAKDGGGLGVVRSAPTGIDCGSDCSEAFPSGTMVTLTATPGADSAFAGWGGLCSGTGSCVVTATGAQMVTATFTCTGSMTFNFTGAVQNFVPPGCATQLTIDASGAQGGNGGGLGAHIVGTLPASGALVVLVGGQGALGIPGSTNTNGSGGGGTFVFVNANDANPLIAAGGGGGKSQIAGFEDGGPGSATMTPTNSTGGAGNAAGGTGANGGGGGTQTGQPGSPGTGGGGAGWVGFGANGTVASPGGGGRPPRFNGGGGTAGTGGAAGGFGGGGGSAGSVGASGGGGGYNGGGGGNGFNNSAWGSGGGGSSFNAGTNPIATAGARVGNGIVIITWQ